MNRLKKAFINSGSILIYEIVAIVCSFILPRFILIEFGSTVNGLVLSITRFLNISTLLDAGVGSVAKAALYKPLAENDKNLVSKIYVSVSKFYKTIGIIFCVYTVAVAFCMPYINDSGLDYSYVFFLTFTISVSTLAQFMIGATNSSLINADQKVYLITNVNTITLILNTIVSVILISIGCNILIVKLSTSIIFAIRPAFAYFYCKKNYDIDWRAKYDEDPVKQKKDGFAHQLAETVLNNVDVIVLTAFSTYSLVSVYSVYALVTDGVSRMISCMRSGMGAIFGNMLVTEPLDKVEKKFSVVELIYIVVSTIVFSCALVMIIPFVKLYTKGISDIDYARQAFAVVFLLSAMLNCQKGIYLMVIYAAGKFKETKKAAYTEMIINLVISVILVWKFDLLGVAIGTLVAMAYRILHSIIYTRGTILKWGTRKALVRLALSLIIALGSVWSFSYFSHAYYQSYATWVLYAAVVFIILSVVTISIFALLYRQDMKQVLKYGIGLVKRKSK